ncbi:MAG TPA: hypothetical protein DEB06_03735, partial [Phycisphaerales bacterium]|nr:hypothetical protein [Phycisphaerales bacterium]
GGGCGGGAHHGGAGGAHVGLIEGVDDAPAIRDMILDRVSRARGAGLGDERAPAPGACGWTTERVEALRAILAEARALRAAV